MLRSALRWSGAAFLIWLAWRIAGASPAARPEDARPLRFVEAAAFQFANPKGWVFALTAAASFLGSDDRGGAPAGALVLTGAGLAVTLLSATTWTLFGAALARWIDDDRIRRRVNLAFALALLATVLVLLRG